MPPTACDAIAGGGGGGGGGILGGAGSCSDDACIGDSAGGGGGGSAGASSSSSSPHRIQDLRTARKLSATDSVEPHGSGSVLTKNCSGDTKRQCLRQCPRVFRQLPASREQVETQGKGSVLHGAPELPRRARGRVDRPWPRRRPGVDRRGGGGRRRRGGWPDRRQRRRLEGFKRAARARRAARAAGNSSAPGHRAVLAVHRERPWRREKRSEKKRSWF